MVSQEGVQPQEMKGLEKQDDAHLTAPDEAQIVLRRRFEETKKNNNLYTAHKQLEEMESQISGEMKNEFEATKQDIGSQLDRETQSKVDNANDIIDKFPRDLQRQERRGARFECIRSDSDKAKQALQELTFGRLRADTEQRLANLLKNAEDAEKADKEYALNEIFAELTTISKQIQDGALPPDLQSQAVKAVDKVTGLRNNCSPALEILPTALLEGDYRTALITVRSYLERGYPEKITDEGGLLGKPGEEVKVTEFYSSVRRYVAQVRKKATDRIEMAKKKLRADRRASHCMDK